MLEQQGTYQFSAPHYRLATALAGVGMWEWDLLQKQPTWDTTCKAMLGYAPEDDVKYEDVLARVHPADQQRVEHTLAVSRHNGTAYDMEYRVVWPDGSLHWIGARGESIADESGTLRCLIGALLDMTAQKQAEELERAVGWQVQNILESITDGLGHSDRAGRLTYINARSEQMGNVFRLWPVSSTTKAGVEVSLPDTFQKMRRRVTEERNGKKGEKVEDKSVGKQDF